MDKNEEEAKLLKECKNILIELLDAARPFTSGDVVDELMSTIPLMEKLDKTIERAELLIKKTEK